MTDTSLALWKCHECSMTFTSPGLLAKHKGKFCPGNTVGRSSRLPYTPRPDSPEHENGILEEKYERLRERERQPHNGRQTVYSRNSDSSMSIYLPDEGDLLPRRNPDPQLAQLAASHGRQMEMLQGKNKDLERQRDEIRRRLEELGRRPIREEEPANDLFDKLREQEAQNQRLLDELRRQLAEARQPINIIAEERYTEQKKPNFTYPIYYGSSLVAEISAIRQAYLQNGGDDPQVLAQLAQMLAEAQAIEDQLRNAPKPTKVVKEKKSTDYMQTLMSLEMENERMQRELMLLQEQNMLARQRRKDDREGRIGYLWDKLRNFVTTSHYDSNHIISSARAITAMPCCGSGCSGCGSGCRGSGHGSGCCGCRTYRPYTSLGLYSLGATFPYGSIYGYSRLSPLRYYDDDDYYSMRRITSFRRPLRPLMWFNKEEKEVVEEEVPEKPKIFMPFSVYPRIDKKKKETRVVESVVSGFRPGERVIKVYSRQETDATPRFGSFPTPRYSFNSAGGRVNTIYTYRAGDGQSTTRSYSVNGIPHMWSAGSTEPVFAGSKYFSYFSPRDGFHKTFPYTSQYKYQNLLPITGTSSYPSSAVALSSSPRNYTSMYPLSRSLSHYPTSRSLAGTLDRYPLSQPLSYRSTPTTLIYRGEQVPLDNPPLVYRGEYIPLENPPLVYRGEPVGTTPQLQGDYSYSGVRVLPVDRYATGTTNEVKEDKPQGKNSKTKKDDKKSKTKARADPQPQAQEPASTDPFVNNPQLAARFYAAGVALQSISRFRSQPGAAPAPASGTYPAPPVIPQTARGQDPLATDAGLASRLQSAASSLQQLREQHARQQAEMAQKAEEAEEREARKTEEKEEKDKMAKNLAEARLKSTQRAVHFMTELNRQEQEYFGERAKTRAAQHAAEDDRHHGNEDNFQPPPRTYKPPPEESKGKTDTKTKGRSDKKKKAK